MMHIDRSAPAAKFGKIWDVRASCGRVGNMRSHVCVDHIMLTSGSRMRICSVTNCRFEYGDVMDM